MSSRYLGSNPCTNPQIDLCSTPLGVVSWFPPGQWVTLDFLTHICVTELSLPSSMMVHADPFDYITLGSLGLTLGQIEDPRSYPS